MDQKIFLLQGLDESVNHMSKLVWAENEQSAREVCCISFAQRIPPGEAADYLTRDPVCQDAKKVDCQELKPEYDYLITNKSKDQIDIEYQGQKYFLRKGHSDTIKT